MHIVNCEHPVTLNTHNGKVLVACGKCNTCRNQRSFVWSQRLQAETKSHKFCFFFTATYNEKYCPKFYKYDNFLVDPLTGECLTDINFWFNEQLDKIYPKELFEKDKERKAKGFELSDKDRFESRLKEETYFERYNFFTYPRFSDIQRMFKSSRQYIARHFGKDTELRYFITAEIGPNTHRIHYHGLIWFDDERLSRETGRCKVNFRGESYTESVLESILYRYYSWNKSDDPFKPDLEPLCSDVRFELSPDRGKSSEYTSKYVTGDTSLPIIFQHPKIRTKFVCSRRPIIGFNLFCGKSYEQIFSERISSISVHKDGKLSPVDVPLFRSVENGLFPKCLGFSKISHYDRVRMYNFTRQIIYESGQEISSFNDVWNYILNKYRLLGCKVTDDVIFLTRELKETNFFWSFMELRFNYGFMLTMNNVKRLYYMSKKAIKVCDERLWTMDKYVTHIETYYSDKDYKNLVKQLNFESEYVESYPNNLPDLLFLFPDYLDRVLTSSHCDNYMNFRNDVLSSFNVDYEKLWRPLSFKYAHPVFNLECEYLPKKYHSIRGRDEIPFYTDIGSYKDTMDYKCMVANNEVLFKDKSDKTQRNSFIENKSISFKNYRVYG